MSLTKHDYDFLAATMKENMEAQSDEQRKAIYREAYLSVANQIMLSDKYKNYNHSMFIKKAGLKK